VNADGLFHASAAYVQTAHAAINPSLVMLGETDQFNACAVALKINGSAGTPAMIQRIMTSESSGMT
jgi:hypothetical protein